MDYEFQEPTRENVNVGDILAYSSVGCTGLKLGVITGVEERRIIALASNGFPPRQVISVPYEKALVIGEKILVGRQLKENLASIVARLEN